MHGQVVRLAETGSPLFDWVVGGGHEVAKLGHVLLRLLWPDPVRLFLIGHCEVQCLVDLGIQHVGLVVELLHQAKGRGAQVLRLLGVLKKLCRPLQENEELGRVCQDLLVFRAIDIDGERQSLVQLIVKLLDIGDEEVLLAREALWILVFIIFLEFTSILLLLVVRNEHRQHLVHLVESFVPRVDAHGCKCTPGVVKVDGDHGRQDEELYGR
mmetsp:Transcript_28728/g.46128  ORF Transcript_28728/g.46128 Transcript_28728/m.46128 type:complete len:212 (+) Transcript_28728:1267-1902(+)